MFRLKLVSISLCSVVLVAPLTSNAAAAAAEERISLGIPLSKLTYKAIAAPSEPASANASLADAPADATEPTAAADPDDMLQQKLNAIVSKYQPQIDAQTKIIEDERKNEKGPLTIDGKCKWDMTSAKFDIPKTTFKNREFSFDLPKTTFKLRQFSFDYPHCDWKMMRIAGIKTKFLKCGRARKEWSTKIPEFKWGRTSFKTKIPEFKWDTTEIKFHTLKCRADDVYIGPKVPKDQARMEEAGRNVETLASKQQTEIQALVEEDLDARGEQMAREIERVKSDFETAMSEMDKSIAEIASNGMDPNSVMVDVDGKSVSLVGARAALAAQRDAIISQMSDEWRKTLETLRSAT